MFELFVIFTLRLPLPAFAASLLFDPFDDPVTFRISEVFFHGSPAFLVVLAGAFKAALFAPGIQPVFGFVSFVELAFIFPLFALTALLHFSPPGAYFADQFFADTPCRLKSHFHRFTKIVGAPRHFPTVLTLKLRIFDHPFVFLRITQMKTLRYEVAKMLLMLRASTS